MLFDFRSPGQLHQAQGERKLTLLELFSALMEPTSSECTFQMEVFCLAEARHRTIRKRRARRGEKR